MTLASGRILLTPHASEVPAAAPGGDFVRLFSAARESRGG
jgi:hypothetical protein